MPDSELAPLAQRMEVHFDELVERLIEQLPSASPFYAALPPEMLRGAAVNLYNILRDSVEDGGIDRYAEAITQIAHTRTAQGGSLDDLRAATEVVRRLNLSLVDELAHTDPSAAVPAFAWLDRLASVSLQIFNDFAQQSLAQQAEELNILMTLSERTEQIEQASDVVEALFEQLPRLGIDRALVSLATSDDRSLHEVIGAYDSDERAPRPAAGTRFSAEPLLRDGTSETVYFPLNTADLGLTGAEREQLAPAGIETLKVFPLRSQRGIYGLLILGYRRPHQLTAAEQRFLASLTRMLRNRITHLRLIESLQRSNQEQQHMLELLRQVSTPLVPVMDGILVMPIVGDLDSRRASQVMEKLLEGVTHDAADIVILDITGVALLDTSVANALVQAARAVRLLGAEALLVGITPEVAQTVVGLGVDLSALTTRGDLQSGIAYALSRRGYRIARDGNARAGAQT